MGGDHEPRGAPSPRCSVTFDSRTLKEGHLYVDTWCLLAVTAKHPRTRWPEPTEVVAVPSSRTEACARVTGLRSLWRLQGASLLPRHIWWPQVSRARSCCSPLCLVPAWRPFSSAPALPL